MRITNGCVVLSICIAMTSGLLGCESSPQSCIVDDPEQSDLACGFAAPACDDTSPLLLEIGEGGEVFAPPPASRKKAA